MDRVTVAFSETTPFPRSEETLIRWPVPEQFLSSPAVAYRNMFAIELAKRGLNHLVMSYVYMGPKRMARLVKLARRHMGVEFAGNGLELGAGCGLLGATVAAYPKVKSLLSVEICEEMTRRVIPKVAAGVLGNQSNKITPIFGSFDDLQIPNESVDFVVEIDSFHHSDNLPKTLGECQRVLKPGGFLLCFDRCHPNHVTDEDVDRMLSEVYSRKFLLANHYPPDVTLTRRENGEHEYRLFEWQAAFDKAGLKLVRIRKFIREVRFALAVKGGLQLLPPLVRRSLYRTENADFGTTLRWFTQFAALPFQRTDFGRPILAPTDTTVFLLRKT